MLIYSQLVIYLSPDVGIITQLFIVAVLASVHLQHYSVIYFDLDVYSF